MNPLNILKNWDYEAQIYPRQGKGHGDPVTKKAKVVEKNGTKSLKVKGIEQLQDIPDSRYLSGNTYTFEQVEKDVLKPLKIESGEEEGKLTSDLSVMDLLHRLKNKVIESNRYIDKEQSTWEKYNSFIMMITFGILVIFSIYMVMDKNAAQTRQIQKGIKAQKEASSKMVKATKNLRDAQALAQGYSPDELDELDKKNSSAEEKAPPGVG